MTTRVDPVRARPARERHADAATLVLASHFPSPSIGRFVRKHQAFEYRYLAP